MSFQYTPAILKKLETALSSPRLAPYLASTEGDLNKAIKLHLWNAQLGETLHTPIQSFELLFRNALNNNLTSDFGLTWYDELFEDFEINFQHQIHAAKDQLAKQGRMPLRASAVIAQFSFGTWVNLLHSRYDRLLWKVCLHRAFPNRPQIFSRRLAKESLENIRILRNRIFHHEPIYKRRLDKDLDLLIDIARWLCPDTAQWIRYHTRFDQVWRSPPL